MPTVFLSYSTKDFIFAELADIKLSEGGIKLWRDRGQLRPGSDWRYGIEKGINESVAVLVALSAHSAESPYVTFEWAYALGRQKPVIPVKLNDCKIHPRLDIIQHLDFTNPSALPWSTLIERFKEIEPAREAVAARRSVETETPPIADDPLAQAVLAYLNQRGYQMASFDRFRRRIDPELSDDNFRELIKKYPSMFRLARLKDGKIGIGKKIP